MSRLRFVACLAMLAASGLPPVAALARGEAGTDAFNPVIGRSTEEAPATRPDRDPCAQRDAMTPPELRAAPACRSDRENGPDHC